MFCPNCGKELPPNANFCAQCGTKQEVMPVTPQPAPQAAPPPQPAYTPAPQQAPQQPPQPTPQPVQTASQAKPKTKSKFVWGIVLSVFGAMGLLGMLSNGKIAQISEYGVQDPADIISILMCVGFIIGGIILVYKSKKQN